MIAGIHISQEIFTIDDVWTALKPLWSNVDPALHRTWNFSKEEIKYSSRNRDSQNESQAGSNPRRSDHQSNALTTKPAIAAAESTENLRYLSDNPYYYVL